MMREQAPLTYQLEDGSHLLWRQAWYFEGRLAFANEADSVSGSISWRHRSDRDDIEIAGPLAQGRVLISVLPGSVSIDDGGSVQKFSGSVNDILQHQLGMDVPINALKYWVLGVSEPHQSFIKQDEGFFQQGWLVRFKEMQQIKDECLPKKLWMEKDRTRIKLIVDHWDLS